ncbi:GNAT family N-acetyltransferase [Embleya sp. NPDC001921]
MSSFRSITESDLPHVLACEVDEPIGSISADRYLAEAADGMYRPEWTWIAERDGRIQARALWWGPADGAHPVALDCLYVDPRVEDRASIGAELIAASLRAFRAAGAERLPLYNVTLTGGWREDPAASAALAWRREAAFAAGLSHEVERLRFEWSPDVGVPAGSGRLTFTEADDDAFLAVFRRIAEGSLDAETRKGLAAHGPEVVARQEMDFYLGCPGRREWWRLAHTADGTLVGLAIPSATPYHPNVGYLGVVPELRGRGYVADLLTEITRLHAARGAELITATTDTTNAPMAAAFRRAGYRTTEVRMVFSAPE